MPAGLSAWHREHLKPGLQRQHTGLPIRYHQREPARCTKFGNPTDSAPPRTPPGCWSYAVSTVRSAVNDRKKKYAAAVRTANWSGMARVETPASGRIVRIGLVHPAGAIIGRLPDDRVKSGRYPPVPAKPQLSADKIRIVGVAPEVLDRSVAAPAPMEHHSSSGRPSARRAIPGSSPTAAAAPRQTSQIRVLSSPDAETSSRSRCAARVPHLAELATP